MWHEMMSCCNLTQNHTQWHEIMSYNLIQNNACDMKWCHVIWHKIMHEAWNDVM